jgi:hypothetical protein
MHGDEMNFSLFAALNGNAIAKPSVYGEYAAVKVSSIRPVHWL